MKLDRDGSQVENKIDVLLREARRLSSEVQSFPNDSYPADILDATIAIIEELRAEQSELKSYTRATNELTHDRRPEKPPGPHQVHEQSTYRRGRQPFPARRYHCHGCGNAIQDEMGEAYDTEYCRMSGMLGLELPSTRRPNK